MKKIVVIALLASTAGLMAAPMTQRDISRQLQGQVLPTKPTSSLPAEVANTGDALQDRANALVKSGATLLTDAAKIVGQAVQDFSAGNYMALAGSAIALGKLGVQAYNNYNEANDLITQMQTRDKNANISTAIAAAKANGDVISLIKDTAKQLGLSL